MNTSTQAPCTAIATSPRYSSADRRDSLAQYFSEMSESTLLDAKSEVLLASRLRKEEETLWQAVLSFAPAVHRYTETINNALVDAKRVSVRGLRARANACIKNPGPRSQAALDKAARKLAVLLRQADPDQEILLGLIRDLQRLDECVGSDVEASRSHRLGVASLQCKANRTRNLFVESNLGLVVSVAKRYQFSGMPLADLIQEGNLGLLRAVSRFDERKGFRFSTYGTWWIRHAVGRGVSDKSRTVRVPVHVIESSQKLKKISRELSGELGRDPTRDELAARAEMSARKMESIQTAAIRTQVSLDAPVGEEGGRDRMEVFTIDEGESAFDRMSILGLSQRAHVALRTLAPIEIEILHRRFGLAGKSATTLQEIANHIGKSRERIRQIQEKALSKLRSALVMEHAV